MPDLSLLPTVLRELGPSSLLQYGVYQLGLRSGWLRWRTPRRAWGTQSPQGWAREAAEATLDRPLRFFFDPASDLSSGLEQAMHGGAAELIRQANAVLQGQFSLFGAPAQDIGFPPRWNRLPGEPGSAPTAPRSLDLHWSAYDVEGDVDWRSLWELSRFGWAFTLARAYRLTGERKYWDSCWALLDSWRSANPPNTGPQWISGQEVGLRILALAFIWYAFAPELRRQPDRAAAILEMVALHAARIPPSLPYARAQRNNHLLSEAVGLYTAGVLFPALQGARRWSRLGSAWLRRALNDQVLADGGYIQHSVNYQRLALGLGLWAHCLAQSQETPLPDECPAALRRLAQSLAALVEPDCGAAPRFGHDDGSQPLPLSTCAHGDMRPILQAAGWALNGRAGHAPGAWDESSFWLGAWRGRPTLQAALAVPGIPDAAPDMAGDFPDAGLYLLRGGQSRAVLRCCRFRSRPAHSDQLHLDLWWKGLNLAVDPGSYRYAGPEPGDNALARAAAHNGPMVAGREPMRRAGRFLWLSWAQGRVLGRWSSPAQGLEALAAEHDGYRRDGWTVRRTVVRAGETLWLVVDELLGRGQQALQVAWTLPGGEADLQGARLRMPGKSEGFRLSIEPETAEVGLYRAGELQNGSPVISAPEAGILGWCSPTYASLQPANALVCRLAGQLPLRMLSWWSLGASQPDTLQVEWAASGGPSLPFKRLQWGAEEVQI